MMATKTQTPVTPATLPYDAFSKALGQLYGTEAQLLVLRDVVARLWMEHDDGKRSPWLVTLQGVEHSLTLAAAETRGIARTLDAGVAGGRS